MAYQAKRRKLYTEDFELAEEDGRVVKTLHVALDPDSMVKKLSDKHVALVGALQRVQESDAKKAPGDALEAIGAAVNDIFEAVFGEDGANEILEFYHNRYTEMCTAVMPFITGVVIPEVRRMSQDNKKAIAAGYSRKERRAFGGK